MLFYILLGISEFGLACIIFWMWACDRTEPTGEHSKPKPDFITVEYYVTEEEPVKKTKAPARHKARKTQARHALAA